MELITRFSLAKTAYLRWMRQYPDDFEGKGDLLKRLGAAPLPDDVDKIIGNGSWTKVHCCDECERHFDKIVELGQKPDYESNTANICHECLNKALLLSCRGYTIVKE